GIAGIQILQTAGPAFPPNTETCSITANPASVVAVDGGTATFTVGVAGPCSIRWTKNSNPIPSQIGTTMVLPVVLADNNDPIRAVVYNNVITNTSTAATLS